MIFFIILEPNFLIIMEWNDFFMSGKCKSANPFSLFGKKSFFFYQEQTLGKDKDITD